jgi:hypothetical protein
LSSFGPSLDRSATPNELPSDDDRAFKSGRRLQGKRTVERSLDRCLAWSVFRAP